MADILQIFQSLITPFLPTAWPLWLLAFVLLLVSGGLIWAYLNFAILIKIFSAIFDFFKQVFGVFIPKDKKWDSARTLILLAALSWLFSLFAGRIVQNIISFMGWLFLIPGIHWIMYEEKKLKELLTFNFLGNLFIGPWVTGALICIFLFTTPDSFPPITLIIWPIVSAIIASLPKFIKAGPEYKLPDVGDRQYLVNLLLINLLLSCWIQLYYSTQSWLAQYPSLMTENLGNSSFFIRLQQGLTSSRGAELLERTEYNLKINLEGKSWSQVELWLLNFNERVQALGNSILDQMPQLAENSFWRVQGQVLPGEYRVKLYSVWQGPSADAQGYHYSKICNISRVTAEDVASQSLPFGLPSVVPAVGSAKVQCEPVQGPFRGQPDGMS
ncbi:DUF5357 family protein [Leptodesmis sp.]|uniref:DUF5357 family protein n=1 Tax=Leptodesmis sp. TaxID=3100501 RepID=UPI00405352ED